jgi:hypothetical protein
MKRDHAFHLLFLGCSLLGALIVFLAGVSIFGARFQDGAFGGPANAVLAALLGGLLGAVAAGWIMRAARRVSDRTMLDIAKSSIVAAVAAFLVVGATLSAWA